MCPAAQQVHLPQSRVMNAKLLSVLAIALLARCARTAGLESNSAVPPLHRADALRGMFAAQLEVTGQTLNEFMCAATLSGLPRHCDDATALLWANATAVNGEIAVAAVLQSLVAELSKDVFLALESIKSIADVVGSGGNVVETVLPGAQPWAVGSASEPTYRGQMVSMSPAVHVPAYSSSDPVAAAIDADVNMLGGTASTLRDLYSKATIPVMVAAMTGAAIYMPAPSRAPDARTQPWFQGAVLPSRNVIIVVDFWTADTEWGVARVAQVVALHPPPAPTQLHSPCFAGCSGAYSNFCDVHGPRMPGLQRRYRCPVTNRAVFCC